MKINLTIQFGSQTIRMQKEFANDISAAWWFESFICSLKNLFHFTTGE